MGKNNSRKGLQRQFDLAKLPEMKENIPESIKKQVFVNFGLRCIYCGIKCLRLRDYDIDHFDPYTDRLDKTNLLVACSSCNTSKGKAVFASLRDAILVIRARRFAKGKPVFYYWSPECLPNLAGTPAQQARELYIWEEKHKIVHCNACLSASSIPYKLRPLVKAKTIEVLSKVTDVADAPVRSLYKTTAVLFSVFKYCASCNKSFSPRQKRSNFCSWPCWYKSQKAEQRVRYLLKHPRLPSIVCAICKMEFVPKTRKTHFCSQRCMNSNVTLKRRQARLDSYIGEIR